MKIVLIITILFFALFALMSATQSNNLAGGETSSTIEYHDESGASP